MKRILLATAITLAVLASPAMADGRGKGNGHGRGHDKHQDRDDRHDRHDRDDDDRYDRRDRGGRGYDRYDSRYYYSYDGRNHPPGRHNGWHKDYRRGQRIDVVYMQPRYYIDDYPRYHLAPPPRGHRWVRMDDGRMILIAVATGIIADVLLHH
ncbi:MULTISPECIES: RcnB family protein [unclassified Lysobacter]|uniref:RcnB family protein n=1 Tax=unclassified Lysobacter TaxID=2635362 RepID=UPI000701D859|nr:MULTISPECIES: RcnB family protein [unclassified Lysobacter]KRA16338.1 hypothetical protein ASD69_16620 [Lysobacter sp. Root604]KRD32038.1 hypothetical protein ASE35_13870 [Lysobacter sp. Root916]KRD75909.1 hypothetical protein ASE43_13850 [Lysobacter sp. Root983]